MKQLTRAAKAAAVLAVGAMVPMAASAQTTFGQPATGQTVADPAAAGQTRAGTGMQMPWQGQFWGHFGASVGAGEIGLDAPPGVDRDRRDTVWRVFGGGRFNNAIGGEIGWVDLGTYDFTPGGDASVEGLDLALVAGVPFATNWNIFGKVGGAYLRSSVAPGIPGIEDGTLRRWGARFGVGVQMGITENLAVRLDVDRFRVRFPGERDNIDTVMLGAQWSFR
jgi:OmpA-OmpF porin, OOP family